MREIGIAFTTSFSGKCKGKDEINSGELTAFRRFLHGMNNDRRRLKICRGH